MAPSRSVRGARVDKSSRRGGGGSGPKTAPSKKKRHSDSSSSTPSDVLMTMESTLCRKCVWDLDTEPGLVCYSSDPRHECTRCAEEKKNCIDVGYLIFPCESASLTSPDPVTGCCFRPHCHASCFCGSRRRRSNAPAARPPACGRSKVSNSGTAASLQHFDDELDVAPPSLFFPCPFTSNL